MKGHVRERGAGNWYAVIDVKDPATGKRRRKFHSLDAKGKREAQIECARLISELDGGTYMEPSKTTMAQYLDRWLTHIKTQVSPRTLLRYRQIIQNNLAPLIGSIVLSKLQPVQITDAYVNALDGGRMDGGGGLSPSTVHHMHRVLKHALSQAVKWQLLARNPADVVDPPKVERMYLQTYDMAQTAALIELVRPTRLHIPVMLAVLCGLRRGEVSALRWRNVDLQRAQLAVVESAEETQAGVRYKEPKSGKARTVALSASVVEELKAHRLRQAEAMLRLGARLSDEGFVVAQEDGTPMRPTLITVAWVRLIRASDLPQLRFHDLRHAHATHLLASGVHPKVASERLGHSRVGITLDLYSHIMPGMQEDAVAKVDAALRAAQRKP